MCLVMVVRNQCKHFLSNSLLLLSHFSHVQGFATLWTVARQAPLSMGFSRQEYWSGLPCPPPEDLPNPGIEPESPELQADSLRLSHPEAPNNNFPHYECQEDTEAEQPLN